MKASRLTAVGLVVGAGLWIASGHFLPAQPRVSAHTVLQIADTGGLGGRCHKVPRRPLSAPGHDQILIEPRIVETFLKDSLGTPSLGLSHAVHLTSARRGHSRPSIAHGEDAVCQAEIIDFPALDDDCH